MLRFRQFGERVFVAAGFTLSAFAQVPAFISENSLDALPTDVAVTPNGLQAVIRCAEVTSVNNPSYVNSFVVVDLQTGAMQAITPCNGTTFGLGTVTYAASDRTACTNDRAISIGSMRSPGSAFDDLTTIDVIALGASPMCLANLVIPNAGVASDVAISPNGASAIVNSRNWIHVIDLSNGNVKLSVPTGGLPSQSSFPLNAADTVECTDQRAVVTTELFEGAAQYGRTWVYVIDLSVPAVTLVHKLFDVNLPNSHYSPHDLAITPDGEMAVVSSNLIVGLYDLVDDKFLASHSNSSKRRFYRWQADSVEVTDDRAVVIADRPWLTMPPNFTYKWSIDVYSIDRVSGLSHIQEYEAPQFPDGHDSAHDLAIAPGGRRAVIRSEKHNIVIGNILTPPASPTVIASPNGANPLATLRLGLQPSSDVFCSDSVVITQEVGGVQIASTLGALIPQGMNKLVGLVDFIDVGLGVLAQQVQQGSGSQVDVVPADLELTRDGRRMVVRYAHSTANPGVIGGIDLSIFNPFSQTLITSFGGSGNVFALDSIGVGQDRVVSVSEQLAVVPPPNPQPFWGNGWVHVIDL